jgi:hypothetical protein
MRSRLRLLGQLMADEMYVVDEMAVADAIVARAVIRLTVPESPFYNALRGSQAARSFRHDPSARSFRLARSPGLRRALH